MSGLQQAGPAEETATQVPARSSGRVPAWLAVAGIVLLAAVVHLILALRVPLPSMWPDEYRYGHLARSLADGDGFVWRGVDVGQTTALYVYLLTPLWAIFHNTVDAYAASKVLNTLAMSLQAIPVYVLARAAVGPRTALVPTALTVAGSWMIMSATVVTEAVAMPLCTAALCVAVLAIYRGEDRLRIAALVLAALAAWARVQLLVLIPAILLAFLLDAVRLPGVRRERLREYRYYLIAGAVISVGGVVAVYAHPGLVGDYSGITNYRPGVGRLAGKSLLQGAGLVAAAGLLPAALTAGAAINPRAWRDPLAGPLLCVALTAAAANIAVSGFFLAGYTTIWWGIERYVWYAIPVTLVLMTVVVRDRRLLDRVTLIGAAVVTALVMLRPAHAFSGEERATWALWHRLDPILGLSPGVAVGVVGLVALAALALAARRRDVHPAAPLAVAAIATGLIFVVQQQAGWKVQTDITRAFRAQALPKDLRWVDHHSGGPVALFGLTESAPGFEVIDFFNRNITQAFGPPNGLKGRHPQGNLCAWAVDPDGTLRFSEGCGPVPRAFFINDPAARMTFHNEQSSVSEPHIGRIVHVAPTGQPRLQSLVVLPCPRAVPRQVIDTGKVIPASAPRRCDSDLRALTWLDGRGELVFRYAGSGRPHVVTTQDGRSVTIAPSGVTSVRVPVAAGATAAKLHQDWTSSAGTPRLLSADLASGGTTTPLL